MPETLGNSNASRWMPLIWSGAILAVVLYNGWRLCCGNCTVGDLVVIPWTGWLLIGINLVAVGILLLMQRRHKSITAPYQCNNCHSSLDPHWLHCPVCGNDTATVSA